MSDTKALSNLAMDAVKAAEAAARAAYEWIGRGEKESADQAAVDALRTGLNAMAMKGRIVIGEGERDEAPMLYIGEAVGSGNGPDLEIAVDPLEGTTVCATGGWNSISVMAIAEKGGLLHAPDTYMRKIAVGPEARGIVDILESPQENLRRLAEVKKCRVQDLTAVILQRDRHEGLVQSVRDAGARIQFIGDGDVAAALATCQPDSGVDILFGIGGAPEGVIAAAALRCLGGDFQGIFHPRNDEEVERAKEMGVEDINKVLHMDDLAHGNVMFCATGVTTGNLLPGVQFKPWGAITHSMVMRSTSGTIRHISAEHHFDKKPRY